MKPKNKYIDWYVNLHIFLLVYIQQQNYNSTSFVRKPRYANQTQNMFCRMKYKNTQSIKIDYNRFSHVEENPEI